MISNRTINKDIKEFSLLSNIDQSLKCRLYVLEAAGEKFFITKNVCASVKKVEEFVRQVSNKF